MGNQPSKGSDGSRTPKDSSSTNLSASDALSNLPSFSKSDTQGSTRSFRGSIRSKIPGSSKPGREASIDSPRASAGTLSGLDGTPGDKSDTASIKSTASGPSSKATRAPSSSSSIQSPISPSSTTATTDDDAPSPRTGTPPPPPSPTMSSTVGKGHQSINEARQTGEVDHVSDAPPSQLNAPSHSQKPGDSILVKRQNQINPRASEPLRISKLLEEVGPPAAWGWLH